MHTAVSHTAASHTRASHTPQWDVWVWRGTGDVLVGDLVSFLINREKMSGDGNVHGCFLGSEPTAGEGLPP